MSSHERMYTKSNIREYNLCNTKTPSRAILYVENVERKRSINPGLHAIKNNT